MVAFFDASDDGRYAGHPDVVTPAYVWAEPPAVRLEKVSAACEAIEGDHYDANDCVLDVAVEGVRRSLIAMS